MSGVFLSGSITELDVITVLPYNNKVVLVKMKGKDIREMLRYSVHRHNDWDGGGRFLQLSGQFSPTPTQTENTPEKIC